MNLVHRTMLGLRRLATPNGLFTFALIGFAGAVEALGRASPSDLYDAFAISVFVLLALLISARHRRQPLGWVAAVERWCDRLIEALPSLTFQLGLDMRGTPPVKRGIPPVIMWVGLTFTAILACVLVAMRVLPHGLRANVIGVSYLLYLGLLAVLWAGLASAILFAGFIPLAAIHDSCVARRVGSGHRSRRGEGLALMAYFGSLLILERVAPLWAAPVASVALAGVYLCGVIPARRFAVQFLWRPRNSIQVRSLSWGQWVGFEFGLIALAVMALTLAACGALMLGDESGTIAMPLTSLMGVTLAWLGPGLLGLLCVQMVLGRLRDPARRTPPTLFIKDDTGEMSRREVVELFAQKQWRVCFPPARPAPLDVLVKLVEQKPERTVQWPLAIEPADLTRDGLMVRLARRDEIQKRRRFFTGLESLWKLAMLHAAGGSGFWLSPHFWFVSGLVRDGRAGDDSKDFDATEDPLLTGSVGPPYHRVFPRSVRNHLFDVLRATQVDLIFVEDRVRFSRLRKVLRVLFEVYDVHGGRRPAEDIDFRGLPGTRVLIHDYQFDDPFRATGYPEPQYEFLGRARILHIFRDRGGDKELTETPFDMDRRPAPAAMH